MRGRETQKEYDTQEKGKVKKGVWSPNGSNSRPKSKVFRGKVYSPTCQTERKTGWNNVSGVLELSGTQRTPIGKKNLETGREERFKKRGGKKIPRTELPI